MPEPLFTKIIADIGRHADHIELLSLFMDGEPLLDNRLPRFIRAAKDAGFKTTNIATNGMLLDGERAKALLESGLDHLIVSIDSIDPETYAAIRIGANLATVERNVLDFIALRNAAGRLLPQIEIRMVVMDENRHERDAYAARWKPIADTVSFSDVHNWGNCSSTSAAQGKTVPTCNWPHRYMVIYSDGRAGFCCLDYEGIYDLGSFQTQSLEEIWHGKAYAQLREWLRTRETGRLPKCAGCTHAAVGPYRPKHWKKLLLKNVADAPVHAHLEYERNGRIERSGTKEIPAGKVLEWGILYEGQKGIGLVWGEGAENRIGLEFTPAQRYYVQVVGESYREGTQR